MMMREINVSNLLLRAYKELSLNLFFPYFLSAPPPPPPPPPHPPPLFKGKNIGKFKQNQFMKKSNSVKQTYEYKEARNVMRKNKKDGQMNKISLARFIIQYQLLKTISRVNQKK